MIYLVYMVGCAVDVTYYARCHFTGEEITMSKADAVQTEHIIQGGKALSDCADLFARECIQDIAMERVSTGLHSNCCPTPGSL